MDMEERVKALEDKVVDIRESVAWIQATLEQMAANLATKADVNVLEARLNGLGLKVAMWAVGAIIATGTLVFGIVRYATPPSSPQNITVTIPPVSVPVAPTPQTQKRP